MLHQKSSIFGARTLTPSKLLPSPQGKNRAYELMLKREARIKPASSTFRHELLKKMQRSNYINEYDRIQGELDSLSTVFGREALRTKISKLRQEQEDLKEPSHLKNTSKKYKRYLDRQVDLKDEMDSYIHEIERRDTQSHILGSRLQELKKTVQRNT